VKSDCLSDVPDCLGSCCCYGFDRHILLVSPIVLACVVTVAQVERSHWCCSELRWKGLATRPRVRSSIPLKYHPYPTFPPALYLAASI
jgi:hypothetical protein